MGFRALQRLLASGGPLRRANSEDGSAIIKAVLRITDPQLRALSDDDLRTHLTAPVLQVGLRPSDMEIEGDRFSAVAAVRCGRRPEILSVSFDGLLREGVASVERACLSGLRTPSFARPGNDLSP